MLYSVFNKCQIYVKLQRTKELWVDTTRSCFIEEGDSLGASDLGLVISIVEQARPIELSSAVYSLYKLKNSFPIVTKIDSLQSTIDYWSYTLNGAETLLHS